MSCAEEKKFRVKITPPTISKACGSASSQPENLTPHSGRSFAKSKFSITKNPLPIPKPLSVATTFSNYKATAAKQKQVKLGRESNLQTFSMSARLGADETSGDGSKLIIRSPIRLKLKPAVDETDDQKRYTQLVQRYKVALSKAPKRPPKVNYTELLGCIKKRMEELDDPQARREIIRKRMRGSVDRCIWDMQKVMENVDKMFYATKTKKDEATVDLEQMTKEEIDRMIAKEVEENKHKALERQIRIRTLRNKKPDDKGALQIFKDKVNNCLETIRSDYNVPIKQWVKNDMLSVKAFTKKYAKPFFIAVKANNTEAAIGLLELNHNLVYDVNNVTLLVVVRCCRRDCTLLCRTGMCSWRSIL
eukprot:TRINITY_DN3542_c0_g1_i4.p1 TRINITY_DN3542_c0_g1~~TRINITY_DN3542_c0_g1_i4.p1  ORF type:complete len:362 (-),score=105.34 TRINITY_DN3542_c0_g1_i4:1310-2395(-)